MITLSTSGNSIIFTFQDNQHYLQNGTIEVPKNSLLLVTDESNMATFKKSASNDIFISALYSELGMTKAELEEWFEENATTNYGGGGGGGDITSGEVQTMIDESISGKADTSAVTAVNDVLTGHTANTTIHVTSSEKSTWNAKSDFSGSYNDLTDKPTIPTVPTSNTAFTNDAGYVTSGYVDSAVSGKQDTLVSGTNIKTINNESLLGSGNIDIQGGGGSYSAGEGISIENDEISTSYSGYTVFDRSTTEPKRFLTNFEGQCLILVPYDCEGSTQGDASFSVDGHSYNFTFHPDNQTFDDNGDSSWQNYFTLEWDDNENAFMLTTIQPIDASDVGCVRFKDLAPVILYSGTTTDALNGAFDQINEAEQVTARALIDLNDRFGGLKLVKLSQQEYDGLTEKDSNTLYVIVN